MTDKEYHAHSREGKPLEDWHRLEDHLKSVAEMARGFADNFGAGDWGYVAGLWHDLGKYSNGPQIPSHIMSKANQRENGRGWNSR
jgi:HD superfamily phosphohydrolase YqeK